MILLTCSAGAGDDAPDAAEFSDYDGKAVHLLDDRRRDDFMAAVDMYLPVLDEDEGIRKPEGLVEVVHGHDGRDIVVLELSTNAGQIPDRSTII
jgi:hypothetical protein